MKRALLLIMPIVLLGCAPKIVYVPTPVPAPKPEIPPPPKYPILTRDSTPKKVIEYFLLTTTLQEGYIKQLLKILEGYR